MYDNLKVKQKRIIKLVVGVSTVVSIFMLLHYSNVIYGYLRPSVEEGRLGNPAVAGVLIFITELLISIGGWVILFFSGLWRSVAGYVAVYFFDEPGSDEEVDGPVRANSFVDNALGIQPSLHPDDRSRLEQALLICGDRGDYMRAVRVIEKLSGKPYPRVQKAVAAALGDTPSAKSPPIKPVKKTSTSSVKGVKK